MTKAEFEKYRLSAASQDEEDPDSDEADAYDDEDETERNKQLARQRRKQEAHLSVYRQQMMKVTGEQPGDVPSLPSGRPTASGSSQSLPSFGSIPTLDPKATDTDVKESSDEDEDVPLGVLQAHGFPTRSRPPTRLTSASTPLVPRADSRMSTYPVPAGATRNDSTTGGGGNTDLPPFARGLPRDPYVGASLVSQPQRESLQQNYQSGPPPLPPGGLVGVIAGEERAKAMRRGSPNVHGTYGMGMPNPGMYPPGMGMPFMPLSGQQVSASEQAQMETNKQMMHMMQMQMQWMQQMMAMNGGQGMQGMQFPPGMMPMQQDQQQAQAGLQQPNSFLSPMAFENNRDSMLSAASSTNGYQQRHRASSNMSQYQPGGGPGPGYAPSIAPSERSNIGQPSRYRPVTPAIIGSGDRNSRTNTMSASASTNDLSNPRSRSPHKLDLPQGAGQGFGAVVNPPSTVRAVNKPKKGTGGETDDEDDAAWAEMRKRRDARRSRWTARKKEKEEAEMPKDGLEGLYYEG